MDLEGVRGKELGNCIPSLLTDPVSPGNDEFTVA